MTNRRNFLLGLGAAIVAPAIIHSKSLMKINSLLLPEIGDGVGLLNFVYPIEWIPLDGRVLKVEEYPKLFSYYGYNCGGQGEVFRIPDCRKYATIDWTPSSAIESLSWSDVRNLDA